MEVLKRFASLHIRAVAHDPAADPISPGDDAVLAVCAALPLWLLMRSARAAAWAAAGPAVKGPERQRLASEAASCLWHSISMLLSVLALVSLPGAMAATFLPWSSGTEVFWSGFPVWELPAAARVLYIWQGAYYVQGLAEYTVHPPKDFAAMVSHHISALVLIATSYLTGFSRVGLGVLAVHEVSDIFLHGAKAAHYAGAGAAVTANVLFVLTVLSWAALRLGCLPRIVFGAAVEAPPCNAQRISVCLLGLLQCLHVYWFRLMVGVLLAALGGGGLKDPHADKKSKGEGARTRLRRAMFVVRAAVRMEHSPRSRAKADGGPVQLRRRSFYSESFRRQNTQSLQGSHLFPEALPPQVTA